jgi:DNA-binding NarL/FixJ family response regulator
LHGIAQISATVRILLADDQRLFREALRRLLETEPDFNVVGEAANRAEAVAQIRELEPDVVLLGVSRRNTDVFALLEAVMEHRSPTRVLLLSDGIDRASLVKAIQMGAYGIVLKNSGARLLTDGIRNVHAGQYWLGREFASDLIEALREVEADGRPPAIAFGLTAREREIIRAVVDAYPNKEIAQKFSISEKTVKHHLTHIFDKLGVSNRLELALFALHHGIVLPN